MTKEELTTILVNACMDQACPHFNVSTDPCFYENGFTESIVNNPKILELLSPSLTENDIVDQKIELAMTKLAAVGFINNLNDYNRMQFLLKSFMEGQ